MKNGQIGLGLLGAGWFGRFCFGAFQEMEEVRPVAIADKQEDLAKEAAQEFGVKAYTSLEELLEDDEVDIVHVATPPATHAELSLQAIKAGKHVLCEKPLATRVVDGRELVEEARKRERVLAVNLMMRYNPITHVVKQMLDEKLLGEPLRAFFENYAKDEHMDPSHWFWNREMSGAIFIEHSVHFFDLFEWWLGEGDIVFAHMSERPGSEGMVEQVSCEVLHGDILCSHYHGFHQAERMDRQEFRFVCEKGDVRLYEWVPERIEVEVICDDSCLRRLQEVIPNAETETWSRFEGEKRDVYSRHKRYQVDGHHWIRGNTGLKKMELYADAVRGLLRDQIKAIRDPSHERQVSEQNGLRSLELATQADEMARQRATKSSSLRA